MVPLENTGIYLYLPHADASNMLMQIPHPPIRLWTPSIYTSHRYHHLRHTLTCHLPHARAKQEHTCKPCSHALHRTAARSPGCISGVRWPPLLLPLAGTGRHRHGTRAPLLMCSGGWIWAGSSPGLSNPGQPFPVSSGLHTQGRNQRRR